ncbi:hypothetical protein [Iodidimonas sp. SYSU 1G8]|uniref:hypothetical protein n=1 Tax=Iodidimonas sp. SYSU 1G8 TaxID=3133967 RepID=UPI0031FED452
MSERYGRDQEPFSFAVRRLQLAYVLSASGSGMLASQRLSYPKQSLDEQFPGASAPRGFRLERDRSGQPRLSIWAEGLERDAYVPARFLKGDWSALAAGRPVAMTVSVDDLERIHGVGAQLGEAVTLGLRERLATAIPFFRIRIGDLRQTGMTLAEDRAVIQGTSEALTVVYPDAEVSYAAPVSVGR